MKRVRTAFIAFVPALLAFAPAAVAQVPLVLPDGSPKASVSQTVGLSEFTVTYNRPAVNKRKVWGALVPYGQPWAPAFVERLGQPHRGAAEVRRPEGRPRELREGAGDGPRGPEKAHQRGDRKAEIGRMP